MKTGAIGAKVKVETEGNLKNILTHNFSRRKAKKSRKKIKCTCYGRSKSKTCIK